MGASEGAGARSEPLRSASEERVSAMDFSAPAVLGVEFRDVEHGRRLRCVRVVRTFIDAQVAELLLAQRPARKHALDRLLDDALGELALEDRLGRPFLDAADIAAVAVIDLLVELAAGEHHLVRVDDDHVVAIVDVGGEARLVLAAQPHGDDRSQAPDDEAFGVDEKPLLLDLGGLGRMGFAEHDFKSALVQVAASSRAKREMSTPRALESPGKLLMTTMRY